MCGIVGACAQRDVEQILLDGLKRLEYRGYDSAGMAIINTESKHIDRLRVVGKVSNLEDALKKQPLHGHVGIAHTRWATHGEPHPKNAHPHFSQDEIAVVHNGIIENHNELRQQLIERGYEFQSQTDTEVIAHLVHYHLQHEKDMLCAIRMTTAELQGAYALGIVNEKQPDTMYAARKHSPLVLGLGDNEQFIASDPIALLPVTKEFIYLEDGDIAQITCDTIYIEDVNEQKVARETHHSSSSSDSVDKGDFTHFMLKEIFEQPKSLADTIEGYFIENRLIEQAFGPKAKDIFKTIERVQIVACGTSYHASLVAKYWLEALASLPCQVEVASEFRYRHKVIEPNTLFVAISQSGETADTLAALRQAKQDGYAATLGICNVSESSLVREADMAFMTRAGTEIGVAATKTFTAQLVGLLLLTIALGQHKQLPAATAIEIAQQLQALPTAIEKTLDLNAALEDIAHRFIDKPSALFLGRGIMYPIAMEGALKLKEISYMHAEAYPAGELKHGPLALVDDGMPIIIVAPNDELIEKLQSNVHEVQARKGEVYIITDKNVHWPNPDKTTIIYMPEVSNLLAPIAYTVPLQLLSYHAAVLKGTDVDQPRNLAKSVTVE